MRFILIIILLLIETVALAQSSSEYFNRAANEFIYQSEKLALNTINDGLTKYPTDKKLNNLKDKIQKEQEEQEQQNQEQQEQDEKGQKEEQNQEQQDQEGEESEEKKDGEEQDEKEGEEQDQENELEEGEEKDGEESEEKPIPSTEDNLEEMNITEEKAKMILEAMKNNEVQYIQQNKRKQQQKRDSSKPDW